MQIQAETFEEDGKLSMTLLSEEDSAELYDPDFEFRGGPIELIYADKENPRLAMPGKLTMKIPKEYLGDDFAPEELFFANYYNGNWEYIMPDSIDLKQNTASIEVNHFSFWGFGRPSEEKQIDAFAQNFAALQWERVKRKDTLHKALGEQYNDLFASMGVSDGSIRRQLTLDMIEYLEGEMFGADSELGDFSPISTLAVMANSLIEGEDGWDDYHNTFLEFTGKALYKVIGKDPGKFSNLAGITGGLSTAAGAMMEGDIKGALQGIADILKGNFIVRVADNLANFVKESGEYAIEIWTAGEIEKAYKAYIGEGKGKYGYGSDMAGDFYNIFVTLGGGQRSMDANILKRYCDKYGLNIDLVGEKMKKQIIANAYNYLEKSFIDRRQSEPEIQKLKIKEEAFIAELKNAGLLSPYQNKKYFKMDKKDAVFNIGDRLNRLYRIKSTVLSLMDEDVAKEITDELLVKVISQWIYWHEQGKPDEIFKYMREMGYIKEPYQSEPSYIWVLTGSETLDPTESKYTSYSISDGNGSFKTTSPLTPDIFEVSYNWTKPNASYKAGEAVKMTVSADIDNYQWHGKDDGYRHEGLNYMTGGIDVWIGDPKVGYSGRAGDAIRLKDTDGKYNANVKTDYGKVTISGESREVSAAFPSGRKEGDKIGIHVTGNQAGRVIYHYTWTKE